MKSIYHFFRLIRPLNLAVIALTMGVFQKFVTQNSYSDFLTFDFILLVLSTVLIAAAGNIINDYFDVKADRVNKPDLLIIDKYIKRRWAIVFNWVFNSLGLIIALYLGWKYRVWLLAIIPFVSINLLWFYSMYFKRTLILGNVIVAFLTGIVPMYILLFNEEVSAFDNMGSIVVAFSCYAFGLNLIREIVKDIADIKGDLLLNSKSMPIVFGVRNTRLILFGLFAIVLGSLIYFLYQAYPYWYQVFIDFEEKTIAVILVFLVIATIFVAAFFIPLFPNRKKYIIASGILKLAMFFGLLTPLFL